MKNIPIFIVYETGCEEDLVAGVSFSENEAKKMLEELKCTKHTFGQKDWKIMVAVTDVQKPCQLSLEDYHKLRENLPLDQFAERYQDFCDFNSHEYWHCPSVDEYLNQMESTKTAKESKKHTMNRDF